MTLLDLLTVMVFVSPFSGAFAEAKIHHGGIANNLIAFTIGLIIAVLFGWLDYKKNRWAFEWFERDTSVTESQGPARIG